MNSQLRTILCIFATFFALGSHASQAIHPYLYQVKTAAGSSYILGTIHGGVSLMDLPSQVSSALHNTQAVAVEIDLGRDVVNAFFANPIIMALKYGEFNGEPLTTEERKILMTKWNIPEVLAQKALSEDCNILTYYNGPMKAKALDYDVLENAYANNKKIIQLDSAEEFEKARRLSGQENPVPPCDLRTLMKEETPAHFYGELTDEINQYLHGEEFVPSKDVFTGVRNRTWTNELSPTLKTTRLFVAVGVDHLFGPNGLIFLLRSRGFEISRVSI